MTPRPQTVRRSVAAIGSFEAPFPAGWFDRLMDWIDRQPGPNAEKDRALAEAGIRFEDALARLHERVDRGDLSDAEKMNHQIASLVAERQALERVSTWPWEKTTVTGFVTALLLPALLWGMQRLLGRFGL